MRGLFQSVLGMKRERRAGYRGDGTENKTDHRQEHPEEIRRPETQNERAVFFYQGQASGVELLFFFKNIIEGPAAQEVALGDYVDDDVQGPQAQTEEKNGKPRD